MRFTDLLDPDRVVCDAHAASKKRALELISESLAAADDSPRRRDIMEALCSREKLGSTALGHGVAIPHARLPELRQPGALFLRLQEPVDFDAPDRGPVDLLFALLVPDRANQEHLEVLAQVAELFDSARRRERMRAAPDRRALYDLLSECQLETLDT